jgi:hypothetical protein
VVTLQRKIQGRGKKEKEKERGTLRLRVESEEEGIRFGKSQEERRTCFMRV